jgi:hypothetical protein
MKLELEGKNLTCMKLIVTGPVDVRDVKILRAGFKKLLLKARNSFLIDLTGAQLDQAAVFSVFEIQIDALVGKIRLVIYGPYPQACQAKNIEEAQAALGSLMVLDRVLIPQLFFLHSALQARAAIAQERINKRPEGHLRTLKDENARLKARISDYEFEIDELLKDYKQPEALGAVGPTKVNLEKQLFAALKKVKVFEEKKGEAT